MTRPYSARYKQRMIPQERQLKKLETSAGKIPFDEWYRRLQNKKVRAIIAARLLWIQAGNLGDAKSIGQGVFEFRIHVGPGYRIYFGEVITFWSFCYVVETKTHKNGISKPQSRYGKHTAMKLRDISETFETDLQDPEFVQMYLEEALNDGMTNFLLALRNVIQANDGMYQISQKVGVGRESLYKTLSEAGNPQFNTIDQVLKALGLRLSIALEPTTEAL